METQYQLEQARRAIERIGVDHAVTNDPDGQAELAEAIQNARERLHLWLTRSLYSLIALFVSCTMVIPFSKGHSLHAHAVSGRIFVYLSMGAFSVSVYCAALVWGAWTCLRDLRREQIDAGN